MANSSGLFSPSVPSLRGKIKPSIGVIGSGIWSPQRISKRVVCSGTIEGSEKISSSQSRLPRSTTVSGLLLFVSVLALKNGEYKCSMKRSRDCMPTQRHYAMNGKMKTCSCKPVKISTNTSKNCC